MSQQYKDLNDPELNERLSSAECPTPDGKLKEFRLPAGSWDCHVHVFEQFPEFPFAKDRTFTPGEASLASLRAFRKSLGLAHSVLVQASVYGSDNRLLCNVLEREQGESRGVAVIDPSYSYSRLKEMHALGVRAVRLNLETFGLADPGRATMQLSSMAEQVAPLGWHIQIYSRAEVLASLVGVMVELPCPVVIDHFGGIDAAQGLGQFGFLAMLEALGSGNVWLKLSAPSRVSKTAEHRDLEPFVARLTEARPDRMIWGSDWPHTGGYSNSERTPDRIEPFKKIDDNRNVRTLAGWLDAERRQALFVDNPAKLYA